MLELLCMNIIIQYSCFVLEIITYTVSHKQHHMLKIHQPKQHHSHFHTQLRLQCLFHAITYFIQSFEINL